MYIALCDDDQTTLKELKSYVSAHFAATAYTVQIDFFSCVEDFLNCRQTYDIVFMDIYYDGMNGMDAVKYMQRTENCQIVFSTASREYAVEAFAVDAAHYLVKPLTQAKVSDALDRCLKLHEPDFRKDSGNKNQERNDSHSYGKYHLYRSF